jgi:hypothetical protein
MDAAGLLDYGAVITGAEVRSVLGMDLPKTASLGTYQRLQLLELGAVDYVRNVLLGHGKYLGQEQGDYRVYLPSENEKQIRQYMELADNKLRRGLKLWRNMPKTDTQHDPDNLAARMMLKREQIKQNRRE